MCTRKSSHGVKINGNVTQDIELSESQTAMEPAPSTEHAAGHGDHEDEALGEIFIHQAIHTIEYHFTYCFLSSFMGFVACSCSNFTELSEVLWNMVLSKGLQSDNWVGAIGLYIIFGAWAGFTLSILVMMEGLSAFLHTLRLHWVEFMSKFYQGLGYAFQPFSFTAILENEEGAE